MSIHHQLFVMLYRFFRTTQILVNQSQISKILSLIYFVALLSIARKSLINACARLGETVKTMRWLRADRMVRWLDASGAAGDSAMPARTKPFFNFVCMPLADDVACFASS